MTKIVAPRLLAADGLIIGTPSYFDLPTGLLKVFMDRSNAILAELTEKKLPYGLVVVGQSNMESLSFATQALERFCGICGMECVPDGHVKAIARDVADVQRNESNMKAARRLGLSLSRKVLRRINPTEDTR
jgi:multimeric flavodoxin WrbA